jgi:hypothetical protein
VKRQQQRFHRAGGAGGAGGINSARHCMNLLIRALKFRQDYRIKKIFLPFWKKGKKHNPSSREGVQSLCQQYSKVREKSTCYWLFSREKNKVNPSLPC